MELNLAGKTALITGSTRGIGRAIAEALYAEGCSICINGRHTDDLASALSAMPDAIGFVADVSVPDEAAALVDYAVKTFGKLDIVVCNVGSGKSVPPGAEILEEWQRVFSVNLWSTTNTVEAAKSALTDTQGAIICISSICGSEVIPGAPVTYSCAKAALHAYVRGMARPLGDRGIRINAVAPGNILFEGSVWERKLAEDESAVRAMLAKEVALSRLGSPIDIANLVTYLASERSQFATGSIWTVDGGQVRS